MIDLKGARENFGFIFAVQLFAGLERQRKPRLIEFAAGVFLELYAQPRHDVERGVKSRRFTKHLHHAPVILQRMQPRPRQDVLPGFRVAILRLVHVP